VHPSHGKIATKVLAGPKVLFATSRRVGYL
jgi:hypothetical protein